MSYTVKQLCESVHVLPTVPGPSWNCAQTLEGALVTNGGQKPCYCVLMLIILADRWFLFKGFERTWSDFKCYCDPELISYTSSNRLSTKTNLNQSLVPGARGCAWEKKSKKKKWHWMLSPATINQTIPGLSVCYQKAKLITWMKSCIKLTAWVSQRLVSGCREDSQPQQKGKLQAASREVSGQL